MRFQPKLVASVLFSIAIAIEVQGQETGAYSAGDCLVPRGTFSCRMYLSSISEDGINYLAEVSCPTCLQGEPVGIGPDGKTEYANPTCQENKTWSDPNNENLDLALTYYDPSTGGETGGTVTSFDQINCWTGGTCEAGSCVEYATGLTDVNTGLPLNDWKCRVNGSDIFYVVKEFGNTCIGQDAYAGGSGNGSSNGESSYDGGY